MRRHIRGLDQVVIQVFGQRFRLAAASSAK